MNIFDNHKLRRIFQQLDEAITSGDKQLSEERREELAYFIAENDTYLMSYDLIKDIEHNNYYRQDSFNTELSNKIYYPIESTIALQIVLMQILPYLCSNFLLGLVSGSLVYSPFVKMRRESDIDLTLVSHKFEPSVARLLPFENVDEIAHAFEATQNEDTAQVCVRTEYQGKHVALHLMTVDWYEDISSVDLFNGPKLHRLRRTKERLGGFHFEGRYDFDGNEYIWRRPTDVEDNMYCTFINNYELTETGCYVNGLLVDMLSISNFYFGDERLYRKNYMKLLSRLSARFHYEKSKKLIHPKNSRFVNIFNRNHHFTDYYRTLFDWCN